MKKVILILQLILLVWSGYSQDWEKINTGYNYIFKGIEFPGAQSQIGYAGGQSLTYMGDGIVIKTSDGGSSWSSLWTGTDQGLEGLSFPDLNIGYACGWSAYFAKTTNAGVSWTPQSPGSDIYYYTDVVFKDANHGVVAAQTNTGMGIYVTSNGGANWTEGSGLTGIPYKVCYVSADTYFLVTNGGDIQKSTNGGLTWSTVYSAGGLLLGIDFYSPMTGMAAGEDGWLFKTYDGGVTWTSQQIAFGYPLWHDFAWSGQNEVFVAGTPEQIYKSMDGGSTWSDDYPQSTGDPALYEILYTGDGIGYICGSQGWFYRRAPLLTAAFSVDNSTICTGSSVHFTDQSVGSPTDWNWTFEGGTPSTSTLQNPVVVYSAPGVYDVTLEVSTGTITNTVINEDYIHVEEPLSAAPGQASGPAEVCGSSVSQYTTTQVSGASGYLWTVSPQAAGVFSGNGLTATFTASSSYTGSFGISVSATNQCGAGPASESLSCMLNHQPIVYSLYDGGGYCNGQSGIEIVLEDSETGLDYQLYRNGSLLGEPVPGTGNELSFGYQTEGDYTVTATNGSCTSAMLGVSSVFVIPLPSSASIPSGQVSVCNNAESLYTAVLPQDANWLTWTLNPAEAGTLSQPANNSALVNWNVNFSGIATIQVQGSNDCGNGPLSPALNVIVNSVPLPVISGETTVCVNDETTYSADPHPGSIFTWTITGGSLVSGQGSNEILVHWEISGNGSIEVSETDEMGCTGISTAFDVLVQVCTGIADVSSSGMQIYPNPVRDVFFIQFEKNRPGIKASLEVRNSPGKVLITENVISGVPNMVSLKNILPGIYLVKLIFENETITKKLIVL